MSDTNTKGTRELEWHNLVKPGACPICERRADKAMTGGDAHHFLCEACGQFQLSGTAEAILESRRKRGFMTEDNEFDMMVVARKCHEAGLMVTSYDIPQSFLEKIR